MRSRSARPSFRRSTTLVDDCRRHVDIPADTPVFISYSPYMNAFAMGLGRPYAIVLFSALVDHLDEAELKYVIRHEMGHIKEREFINFHI